MQLVSLAMIVAVSIAAVLDIRSRRIPNWLTGTFALVALALHVPAGLASVGDAFAALALTFLGGTVLFSLRVIGGGDVKLLAGCAASIGLAAVPLFLLAVGLAGGVLAVLEALRRRRLVPLLMSTAHMAAGGVPTEASRLPYGVAIAAASYWYALSPLVVPHLRSS